MSFFSAASLRASSAPRSPNRPVRVLVTGWAGLEHGEATAGDVLAIETVSRRLDEERIPHDIALSRVMHRPGTLVLADVDPTAYTDLVFVCGPLTGPPVAELAERFEHARRLAVGVSVMTRADAWAGGGEDPESGEVRDVSELFDVVIPRDRGGPTVARRDLAAVRPAGSERPVPVVGVVLTTGQGEYGARRRHEDVAARLEAWAGDLDVARVPLDTRLDPRDWRLAATPAQLEAVVARLDVVVTMRLHGLILALRAGVPALAVDPVAGGGKVSAQARAWEWPSLLGADELDDRYLSEHLGWCLSGSGRAAAAQCRDAIATGAIDGSELLDPLVDALTADRPTGGASLLRRRAAKGSDHAATHLEVR